MITPAIEEALQHAADVYQVPVGLLRAIANVETGGSFRTDLVSPAGAQGLMQLMPATAQSLGVSDPFDPREAALGAAKFMRHLLAQFGNDWERAIAAYNAGAGYVTRHVDPSAWYDETRNYVRKVFAHWNVGILPSFDAAPASVVDMPQAEPPRGTAPRGLLAGAVLFVVGLVTAAFVFKGKK